MIAGKGRMRSTIREIRVVDLFSFGKSREAQRFLYKRSSPKNRGRRIGDQNMALTRKLLRTMGIEDDKVDQIIEAHTETVDGLKDALEKAQAEAEKLPELQKQLETAQADLDTAKKDSYKVKYEAIKENFEAYKAEQTQKETRAAKETAFRALLKAAGVSEKRMESVLRVSDVDSVELDDKGKITGAKEWMKSIQEEWADFIETTETQGAQTPNPPANTGGGTMTRDDILKIRDASDRQRAIAENIELFRKE